MTRYVYGSTKRTASKGTKRKGTKRKRTSSKGTKRRKMKGGKKTGFLGGLLKPLVLPALFFGAQKVQQKRVRRRKSRRGKK